MKLESKFFGGNEISKYGQENGRLDYGTLAKAFNHVLANDLMKETWEMGWEQLTGFVDNSEEIEELTERQNELSEEIDELFEKYDIEVRDYCSLDEVATEEEKQMIDEWAAISRKIGELYDEENYSPEIYQYYIVDNFGSSELQEIGEIVFYCEKLDIYLWGVTHYGTSWDYVLTSVECMKGE